MASPERSTSLKFLVDVLEEIPLDVVEANVWRQLPDADRCHLRLASKRCLQLADSLITCAAHDVDLPVEEVYEEDEEWQLDVAADPGNSLAAWAAFLSRLPRLSSLELRNWDSDDRLARAMLHLGHATASRVTRLELCGTPLSLLAGCAARAAFPGLQELVIGASARMVQLGGISVSVCDEFFLPFKDSHLTSIQAEDSSVSLGSLHTLTRLRQLDLQLKSADDDDDIEHLSVFTDLRHLRLNINDFTSDHSAALYALTQLTHLSLDVCDYELETTTADTLCASAGGAALSHLSHLQALHLCDRFVVDATLFADVRQLTRLTALSVGRIALSPTALPGGCLPALCALCVDALRPYDLLHTLLPLLPLPSLTSLDSGAGCLCIHVGVEHDPVSGGGDSEVQAGALKDVGLHLAAAAQMQVQALCLARTLAAADQLSLPQVAEGLAPLAGRLSHLRLHNVAAHEWDAGALGRRSRACCCWRCTLARSRQSGWPALPGT